MTELILAAVIIALIVDRFVQSRMHYQERLKLVNRVVARHTGEVRTLDADEAPKKRKPPREEIPPPIGL